MATTPKFVARRLSAAIIRKWEEDEQYSLDVDNRPIGDIEEDLFVLRKAYENGPMVLYVPYDAALVTPIPAQRVVEVSIVGAEIVGLANNSSPLIGLTAATAELREFDDGMGGTVERLAQYVIVFSPFVDLAYTPAPGIPIPSQGEAIHFHTTTGILVQATDPNASTRPVALALDSSNHYAFTGHLTDLFQGALPAIEDPESVGLANFKGNVLGRYALEDHIHSLPPADDIICWLNENATLKIKQSLLDLNFTPGSHSGLTDMPSLDNPDHDGRYVIDKALELPGNIYQDVNGGAARVSFNNDVAALPGAPDTVQAAVEAVASQLATVNPPIWFMRRFFGGTSFALVGHTGTVLSISDDPSVWLADPNEKGWPRLSGSGAAPGSKMHANDPYTFQDYMIQGAPDGSFHHVLPNHFPDTTDSALMYLTFDVAPGVGTIFPTFFFDWQGSVDGNVAVWLEKDLLMVSGPSNLFALTKTTSPFSAVALVSDAETEMFRLRNGSVAQPSAMYKWVPPISDNGGVGQRYRLYITRVSDNKQAQVTEVMSNLFSFSGITAVNTPA